MEFKGSFLARDTRSHQGDGTYVIRLLGIFGILVRSTMVIIGICLRITPMQPMVQLRAGNSQLGQDKLRYQEQGSRFPDRGIAPARYDGSIVV